MDINLSLLWMRIFLRRRRYSLFSNTYEYEYIVQCPQCKRGVDKNVYYSGNIATDY